MKCAYHFGVETTKECPICKKPLCDYCKITCNKCGLVFCQECVEVINGKTFCRICALNVNRKGGPNWFQRHLNWTFFLAVICGYLVGFTYGPGLLSNYYPNVSYDIYTGLGFGNLIATNISIPLGLWVLHQKYRKFWWIFILFVPFGWIIFLCLENRILENRSTLQESTKDATSHIETESTEGLSIRENNTQQPERGSTQSNRPTSISKQRKDKDTKNFCPSCGYKVTKKMVFCPKCGGKLS